MSGTAKHYVLNDGRNQYVDHKATATMLSHIKMLYGNSALRATRDKGIAILEKLTLMEGPWRKRLLAAWKELKPLVSGAMALTEFRVRPKGSTKSCKFRRVARDYRSFKPKNPKKGLKKAKPVLRFDLNTAMPAPAARTGRAVVTGTAPNTPNFVRDRFIIGDPAQAEARTTTDARRRQIAQDQFNQARADFEARLMQQQNQVAVPVEVADPWARLQEQETV